MNLFYLMNTLAVLILAHLLADFALQTNKIAQQKEANSSFLLIHVGVHVVVTFFLFECRIVAIPMIISIGIAHYVIDFLKPKMRLITPPVQGFLLDQAAHFAVLLTAAAWVGFDSNGMKPHLPPMVLYPSVAVGFLLFFMMLFWIWAHSLDEEYVQRNSYWRWMRARLLSLEQRIGVGLLCIVGVSMILQSLSVL